MVMIHSDTPRHDLRHSDFFILLIQIGDRNDDFRFKIAACSDKDHDRAFYVCRVIGIICGLFRCVFADGGKRSGGFD